MSERVVIKVHPKFAKKLKESWEEFNRSIALPLFNKEITFTDYTKLLANSWDEIVNLIFGKGVFIPIKKGRKSKKIDFDLTYFPI